MSSVGFDEKQLGTLLVLHEQVRVQEERDRAALEQLGVGEAESLAPVYQDLVTLYAHGADATEADLTALAPRLETARSSAYGATDPRGAHYGAVMHVLDTVAKWVRTLPKEQQDRLGQCRFFLQRRLGPFTNPGDYEKWLGTAWNGSDFASLRANGRPVDEGQMDIGGLWTDDASADQSLPGLRVAVLLLFALEQEGFAEAVQVRLGVRAPDDYTPAG